MSNTFMNGLKMASNYTRTENHAITHRTTKSALLDLFAMGAAYRTRSEEDCILLFRNAFAENPTYALKCLFYIADVRGGQGERRFFRVCINDLAKTHPEVVRRNLELIPIYRRWDDLYALMDTPLENAVFLFMKKQLALDVQSKTPSLLGKWLKSENASSKETKALAIRTRKAFGMTAKQYRKTLSYLRERINVLERLMSAGKWDEIEFDKIPSRAGLIYKNAFARHDVERAKSEKNVQTYADFAKDEKKSVNAEVLNPVDIANKAFHMGYRDETGRAMLDKYWTNLKDYYQDREENAIAICDVSGSMCGEPLNAAVSMSAYIAERGKGPFKDYFMTFSSNPQLVKFEGVDIYDKFNRAIHADWGMNTNIEAAMDLLLKIAVENNVPVEDVPARLYIFTDMEFDQSVTSGPVITSEYSRYGNRNALVRDNKDTLFEMLEKRWRAHGYEMPKIIFWNLNARNNNIPALGGRYSYVSGFSISMVETILSGKDGYDLMMEKLNTSRYECIH